MQSSNSNIPKSNNVSRVYNVAAILWLQFTVHAMQFPMINILYFSIVIIIITIIIPVTTCMQGIYNNIPDTNHVSIGYTVLQLFWTYNLCYT